MDPSLKVVTAMPLHELWRSDGSPIEPRGLLLSRKNIRELLRLGPIEFVIADAGLALQWIPISDCYKFWRAMVKPHLAEPDSKARLEEFPDQYCYFASQWREPNSKTPIVLLERYH